MRNGHGPFGEARLPLGRAASRGRAATPSPTSDGGHCAGTLRGCATPHAMAQVARESPSVDRRRAEAIQGSCSPLRRSRRTEQRVAPACVPAVADSRAMVDAVRYLRGARGLDRPSALRRSRGVSATARQPSLYSGRVRVSAGLDALGDRPRSANRSTGTCASSSPPWRWATTLATTSRGACFTGRGSAEHNPSCRTL